MTDWFDGYDDLLSKQLDEAHTYDIGDPNWIAGRMLLTSIESLRQAIDHTSMHGEPHTTDGERLQFLLSRKFVHHFDSCFELIRNELYNPSRSQIRFLFESYLLLRGLNRDKERSAEIYQDTVTQLQDMGPDSLMGERLATINEFDDIINDERERISSLESDLLWLHTSVAAVHPYSIESADLDNKYDEEIEGNLLDITAAFAFGIGAQLIKTWKGTPLYWELFERLDPMIVRIRISSPGLPPRMFEEDLDLWAPESIRIGS